MSANGFTSVSDRGLPPNGRTHGAMNAPTSAPVTAHSHGTEVSTAAPTADALSYAFLRTAIGIIGILLPAILWTGLYVFGSQAESPDSISAYYYTVMRNVFVGSLFAIGIFLLSYRDYRADTHADDIASTLGCLFALGVALFPTPAVPTLIFPAPLAGTHAYSWVGRLHFTFAALFFLTMTYFCLFLFTKTHKGRKTQRKVWRNHVYRSCGIIIICCIALLAYNTYQTDQSSHLVMQQTWLQLPSLPLKPYRVFALESIAIMAFGFSWLVKGGLLLADKAKEDNA